MRSRLSAAELAAAAETILIALACAADSQAFSEIVRRRQSGVRHFMYRLCRDRSLGDDLAQQVFIKIWRGLPRLREVAAFDGWLRRVMVTTWLEELRRRKLDVDAGQDPDTLPAREPPLAERWDLDAALARLAPHARLCVVLAYHDGLSHAEIAELTGLALGTVKSHVVRGAARLRQLMDGYAG